MASADALPIPRKNTAMRVTFALYDADGDLVSGATGLDSEVSKDGGSFTDATSEATEIGSTGIYYLDLTSTEMNADTVAVQVKTSSSGAKTTVIVMYPEEAGDVRADVVAISGDSAAADNLEAAADGTGYNLGGGAIVAASVTAGVGLADGAITAAKIAADAITDAKVASDVTIASVTGSVGSVATGGISSASFASGATIPRVTLADTLTTYTGNTPQTGDSYTRLGAPAGASVSADIASNTSSLATLLARIGAFTGTGINTVLGFFKALAKSDASAPSDMGGTFNPATDSLEAAADNGGSAASVWAYATRTLTQGAASVTAAVTGSSVTVYRGTRWSIALTGLPTNAGYTAIILSVKRRESDADSAAIFQVRTSTGLTAFAGAPTVTAGQAAITVNSSTAITITCEAATTQYATPGTYSYGIKYLDASGFPSQASDGGVWTVVGDIPKAIS